MPIKLQDLGIYLKICCFFVKLEHFCNFHVFLKKQEAEDNFPDNPSQNIGDFVYVLT